MNEDEKIDISEEVEALPEARVEIAFERACRAVGYTPEDEDDEVFLDAFKIELAILVASDTFDSLEAKGFIEVDHIDPDTGEFHWRLTEEAEKIWE